MCKTNKPTLAVNLKAVATEELEKAVQNELAKPDPDNKVIAQLLSLINGENVEETEGLEDSK